jgi:DNA-binding response OmpR family regulator
MLKVLLIEDDDTMLSLLKTLLEIEGFQVSTFNGKNSGDPLTLIRQESPQVIILDVHLRYASGLDITRQIRKDEALKSLPVLMTSGMDLRSQCMAAGANEFLLKPYMPDDLVRMIRGHSPQ